MLLYLSRENYIDEIIKSLDGSSHCSPLEIEFCKKTFAIQQKIYFSEKRRQEDLHEVEKLFYKKAKENYRRNNSTC
jgi:hypothetical protein